VGHDDASSSPTAKFMAIRILPPASLGIALVNLPVLAIKPLSEHKIWWFKKLD
jgi:hypothetical protein